MMLFARNHAAPLATSNPAFLKDLESAMALTVTHGLDRTKHATLMEHQDQILSQTLRREVADRVNEGILTFNHRQPQAQLRELVRLRSWVEDELRGKGRDVPDWEKGRAAYTDDEADAMDTSAY